MERRILAEIDLTIDPKNDPKNVPIIEPVQTLPGYFYQISLP